MIERISNGYRRLFEIRLLHHYWLDEGATVFDLLAEQTKKDTRLLQYDVRSFLAVTPTVATLEALRGFRGVYKNTALGCLAAVPDHVVVPHDAMFEFIVTVRKAEVFNYTDYTALTLRPQKIYEVYYQPEERTYRYKENVPVLSNLTGAARGTGLNKALFLSREISALAADDQVEALILSGSALVQLTSDQPGASTQQLHDPATALPIFVHQGDVPAIVPPSGLVGAPARGVILSSDITNDVFVLIRVSAIRADDGDFSCIDSSGHAKTAHPVFQVRFKNRSTIWQYLNKSTGVVDATEPHPLPLTYFGNAGTKQKPAAGLVKAVKSGTKIAQLVSEIFV
jgi:hypothetical protein